MDVYCRRRRTRVSRVQCPAARSACAWCPRLDLTSPAHRGSSSVFTGSTSRSKAPPTAQSKRQARSMSTPAKQTPSPFALTYGEASKLPLTVQAAAFKVVAAIAQKLVCTRSRTRTRACSVTRAHFLASATQIWRSATVVAAVRAAALVPFHRSCAHPREPTHPAPVPPTGLRRDQAHRVQRPARVGVNRANGHIQPCVLLADHVRRWGAVGGCRPRPQL